MAKLAETVGTGDDPGGLPGALDRGNKHGDEDCDNANDDDELDERKGVFAVCLRVRLGDGIELTAIIFFFFGGLRRMNFKWIAVQPLDRLCGLRRRCRWRHRERWIAQIRLKLLFQFLQMLMI